MGNQLPLKRGTPPPHFSAHVYCGQQLDGSRCHLIRRGVGPGDIVLDEDPAAPLRQRGHAPNFRLISGQMAGLMPHGMKVGLGPGDIVLDGHPVHQKGAYSPDFQPMSVVAKRPPRSQLLLSTCFLFPLTPSSNFFRGRHSRLLAQNKDHILARTVLLG